MALGNEVLEMTGLLGLHSYCFALIPIVSHPSRTPVFTVVATGVALRARRLLAEHIMRMRNAIESIARAYMPTSTRT